MKYEGYTFITFFLLIKERNNKIVKFLLSNGGSWNLWGKMEHGGGSWNSVGEIETKEITGLFEDLHQNKAIS